MGKKRKKSFNSACEQCGARIPADAATCQNCTPRKKTEVVPGFLVIALLAASVLMLGSSLVNVASAPAVAVRKTERVDLNLAAYHAAKQFIQERFPGPKAFADYAQSSIDRTGTVFTVTLACEDLAVANEPVRNYFKVQMEYGGGGWKLKEIVQ